MGSTEVSVTFPGLDTSTLKRHVQPRVEHGRPALYHSDNQDGPWELAAGGGNIVGVFPAPGETFMFDEFTLTEDRDGNFVGNFSSRDQSKGVAGWHRSEGEGPENPHKSSE